MEWLYCLCGVIGAWFILGSLFILCAETTSKTVYNVLKVVIPLPCIIIFMVLAYPSIIVWRFIRNAVRGVTAECWEKAGVKKYVKLGNYYLCYDTKARSVCNKLFLVRVVRPKNRITHSSL
jgi:hypothetical protein